MKFLFKSVVGAAMLLVAVPAAAQGAMAVSTFLARANALKKKGPLALFSGDLKLLMNQMKRDSAQLRAENQALAAAGKRKHYCTPEGFSMNEDSISVAMQEVPAAERSKTSTKDALRMYIARRHPCRG